MIRVSGVSALVIKSQGKGYSKCHSADAQLKLGRPLQPPHHPELRSNILGNSNFKCLAIFFPATPTKLASAAPLSVQRSVSFYVASLLNVVFQATEFKLKA